MKILLQHTKTRAFFSTNHDWTADCSAARLFATSQELWSFCTTHRLEEVQMIVKFEDSRFDMTIPFVPQGPLATLKPETILLVEDNADDIVLIERAFRKTGITDSVQVVNDGEQALGYLSGEGIYSDRNRFPLPRLIVMDVKMPRMNGLEVLRWIDTKPDLRSIPKIILSSSQLDSDVVTAYNLGANTYFAKPTSFEDLLRLVKSNHNYWFTPGAREPVPVA